MRFFEFKLPEKESPFFKEIFAELSKLVDMSSDLPEDDPVRQQVSDYLDQLKQDTGITESDTVMSVEQELLVAIAKSIGGPNATKALLDIKKLAEAVKSQLAKVGQAHQQKGKEEIKLASAEKQTKAAKLAAKIGKDKKWGISLNNALSLYDNDELHTAFLDSCLENKGLTKPINAGLPFQKLNLKNIINPTLSGIFDNQEAFNGLALLPFTEGTGLGSGVGPGESLFACLIPNAKKASKSDLMVGDETWEVKGGKGQESTGWLDATGAKATDLRRAFASVVDPLLRPMGRKKFKYSDGTETTVNDIIDNADFRPEKFRNLKTIFQILDSKDQIKAIDAIYTELSPTVKTDDRTKKLYNKSVKDTVNLILSANNQSELGNLNRLQAKLSMIEYAIGAYKASNFLIYNYVTQDIVVIQGLEGIEEAIDSSNTTLITTAITMRGSGAKKGSPGISIKTRDIRSRTKGFD